MSRAKKLSLTVRCSLTLPKQTYDYLTFLANQGRLGATEPEVAAHILIEELDRRLSAGYHRSVVPTS